MSRGYIPGDHLILCYHCSRELLASNGWRDRSGKLACKLCYDDKDLRDSPHITLPHEKNFLPGTECSFEQEDTFHIGQCYMTIETPWDELSTQWNELGSNYGDGD